MMAIAFMAYSVNFSRVRRNRRRDRGRTLTTGLSETGPTGPYCCQVPRRVGCVPGHWVSVTQFPFLGRRTEEYGLSHRQATDASDRAVDSRVVLVRTNDRFHHFWGRMC